MRTSARQPGQVEIFLGIAILLCLGVIAVGVFRQQYRYNPAVLAGTASVQSKSSVETKPANAPAADFSALLPPELTVFGAMETFNADNLFDKIDGKAELYLSSGFVGLRCQRFAVKAEPDNWLEFFVYDMGGVPQAFAVYSGQHRADAQPLDLTPFAYKTANAFFFACGRYYLEVVTATPTEKMLAGMSALSRNFVAENPPGDMRLPELAFFPAENLQPGSFGFQVADTFGFDRFKNVFSAKYRAGDAEVQAFVTLRSTPEDAVALRDAYQNFLLANGGKELPAKGNVAGAKPVNLLDTVEIVFSQGKVVAGVHAAPNQAAAEQVAALLSKKIAEVAK
jgi:uncharacterized protein DUF6599